MILGSLAGAIVIGEYFLFVAPNTSSALQSYWATDYSMKDLGQHVAKQTYRLLRFLPLFEQVFQNARILEMVVGWLLIGGFGCAYRKFRKGNPNWLSIQVICLLPCLLVIISDRLDWYPLVDRTGLFLLPHLVVLLVRSLQLTLEFIFQTAKP
jgi:hypothetical protein